MVSVNIGWILLGLVVVVLLSGYLFGGFSWFRSRFISSDSETIILARLNVLLGVLMAVDVAPLIPSEWMPYYVMGTGLLGEIARRLRADDV